MPPSVHKLTPFEKRLRRNQRLRDVGHEPTAPNCFWADAETRTSRSERTCTPCTEMRRKHPELNRVLGKLTR